MCPDDAECVTQTRRRSEINVRNEETLCFGYYITGCLIVLQGVKKERRNILSTKLVKCYISWV